MRLSEIVIRKFKCLDKVKIVIPKTDAARAGSADFVSIIGRNNTGKSSVMEAIRLALPESAPSQPTRDHFPQQEETLGPIEVELSFDELDEADREKQAIRAHVYDDEYRIKKVWHSAATKPEVFAFHPVRVPIGLTEEIKAVADVRAISEQWAEAVDAFEKGRPEPLKKSLTKDQRTELVQFVLSERPDLVQESAPDWVPHPGGIQQNVDSVLPLCIFVPAIRETKVEADPSSSKSAARQLVDELFRQELFAHETVQQFQAAGVAVRDLFVGDKVHEAIKQTEDQITEKLDRLIHLKAKLDFTPPDISTDLAGKTSLLVMDGKLATPPEHQGHGAQRSLVLSLLELLAEARSVESEDSFRRGLILLVEEPEIYLHPHMCRKMRTVLTKLARSAQTQVVCTTHSPVFMDLADRHDGIVITEKDGPTAQMSQRTSDVFDGADAESQRGRLRMLLDFDPAVNEVFFADRVILVEGDSEVAAVGAVLDKLVALEELDEERCHLCRADATVVNCRGKWTICAFQRVLNAFGKPYCVIHDKDSDTDETGATARILELLGNDASRRLLHDPNFEQDIFGQNWSSDKPWRAVSIINQATEINPKLMSFIEFILGCGNCPYRKEEQTTAS